MVNDSFDSDFWLFTERDGRRALPDPGLAPPEPLPRLLEVRGACRDAEPEIFDIDDSRVDPATAGRAKRFCRDCPVQFDCLAYALRNVGFGILGGLDALERHALRTEPLSAPGEREAAEEIRRRLRKGESARQIADDNGVTQRSIERFKSSAGLTEPRSVAVA